MPGFLQFVMQQPNRLEQRLMAFGQAVSDLRPFWQDEFGPWYFGQVQDLFALEGQTRGSGGRFGTGQWKPLSPWYARWKAQHYPGTTILVRTGALRNSVSWPWVQSGAWGIWDPQPTHVTYGTKVPYAPKHQYGNPATRLPARPFLPPVDAPRFTAMLSAWILRRSGQGTP